MAEFVDGWISDERGNKCSVEYWGSEEDARKALASNKRCDNCINCSDCSDCSRCSDCSDCSGCSGCSRCSDCSDCSRCSDCSDCSGCSRCSDCSDCSGCSRCSDCSDCSHIAWLVNKKGLQAEPGEFSRGAPPIPTIENINQKIFEAASKPNALKMTAWHTCGTTHCRAGWAVHLAGDAGYALEKFHGSLLAGQLIYRESGSPISPVRFFDGNNDALADMKRMAEAETSATTSSD